MNILDVLFIKRLEMWYEYTGRSIYQEITPLQCPSIKNIPKHIHQQNAFNKTLNAYT